jgi:sugar lactone lactonase YvrE
MTYGHLIRTFRLVSLSLLLVGEVSLSGCSGSGNGGIVSLPRSLGPSDASKAAASLYVLNDNDVAVYKIGSTQPSRSISNGISFPTAMTLDKSGNLYVANYGSGSKTGSVVEYSAGTDTIARTITNGADRPHSLAVDSNGTLYVGNGSNTFSVSVYAPGQLSPKLTVTTGDLPQALIVHPTATLYVLNGVVSVFSTRSGKLKRQIDKGMLEPTDFSFSPSNELYVTNCGRKCNDGFGYNGALTAYDAKTGKLVSTIKKDIASPGTLVFGRKGILFVANYIPSQGKSKGIAVFTPGNSVPSEIITKGVDSPSALLCDSQSRLYVANIRSSTLSVFPSGSTSPETTISVGLKNPSSLAFGP